MKISDLNAAIVARNLHQVDKLLKLNDSLLSDGYPPLALALDIGNVDIIKRLLKEDFIYKSIEPGDARDILERAKNIGDDSLIRQLLQIDNVCKGIQQCDPSESVVQSMNKIKEGMETSIDAFNSMPETECGEMLSAEMRKIELDDKRSRTLDNPNSIFSGNGNPNYTVDDVFLPDVDRTPSY